MMGDESENNQGRTDNCPEERRRMRKYIFTDLEGLVVFLVIIFLHYKFLRARAILLILQHGWRSKELPLLQLLTVMMMPTKLELQMVQLEYHKIMKKLLSCYSKYTGKIRHVILPTEGQAKENPWLGCLPDFMPPTPACLFSFLKFWQRIDSAYIDR